MRPQACLLRQAGVRVATAVTTLNGGEPVIAGSFIPLNIGLSSLAPLQGEYESVSSSGGSQWGRGPGRLKRGSRSSPVRQHNLPLVTIQLLPVDESFHLGWLRRRKGGLSGLGGAFITTASDTSPGGALLTHSQMRLLRRRLEGMSSLSFRRRVGLAAVGALFLVLLLPVTAQAATQDYGSIAYSPSKKVVEAGFAGSQSAAATAAVQQCFAKGGASDCWAVMWFRNAVGALARASNPAGDPYYAAGYGFASDVKDATASADKYAKEGCQQRGGKDCGVIFRAQTPTVSSSGSGGALTQPPAGAPKIVKKYAQSVTVTTFALNWLVCFDRDHNPLGYILNHTTYVGWSFISSNGAVGDAWYQTWDNGWKTVSGPAVVDKKSTTSECGLPQ